MEGHDKIMKKYIGLIAGIAALIVILAGAGILYSRLSKDYGTGQNLIENNKEEPDKVLAVDFTVEDASGEEVNLYSLIGKPIVLNFWASWCGPCKSELPDFQAAYEKYEGDVEFLMVNMTDGVQETRDVAAAFMEEQGFTLPVYYDTAQDAAYTYGVFSIPTTYFIAPDGEIVAGAQGMLDAETLEVGISMIYSGE